MSVELAFDRIDGAQPKQTVAFLHGILGRGHNLRTIARRFVEECPDWTAWLVDLRGHGRSPKSTPGGSLEAAASDVTRLAAKAEQPLAAVVGHSFGGKVALEAARSDPLESLRHVVVIDSMPGTREPLRQGDAALAVIDTIESLPRRFASRTEFINGIVAAGLTPNVAKWLAQSLEKDGDHVHFMLDL